ncbi:MAG: hypothetical protein ABJN42_10540 [Roseibium sp.]|uniref:hypothetical protein n=1 Tax=Roseibium sp. TaxID=1936156 RepID=UPI003299A111
MSTHRVLNISDQHVSRTTADLVADRIENGNGMAFFRQGEKIEPMFGDMTFQVSNFARLYEADPERLERALPHDLLFLHLYAKENGYQEIVISERFETDDRLPIYRGNALENIGDLLRDQDVKLSDRKPRQRPEADRVMGVAPRQIREGKLSINATSLEAETPVPG